MRFLRRSCALVLLLGLICAGQTASRKESADDLYREGTVALQTEAAAKAEFWFKELRASYPRDPRWGLGLMSALSQQGRYIDALKVAREIQGQYPRSAAHAVRIALLLLQTERFEDALDEAQLAITYNGTASDRASAYMIQAQAYGELGDLNKAIAVGRRYKDITGRASVQLALLLGAAGKKDEEIEEYREVMDEPSPPVVAFNNLSYALAERNQSLQEALVLALQATQLDPGNSFYVDTLGWVYYRLGRLEDAERELIRAATQEEGNQATILEHVAVVLDARGIWTPERRELRDVLRGPQTPRQLAKAKELLVKMQRPPK